MTRQLAFALGIALAFPALAQEHAYEYQDDGSGWTAEDGGEAATEEGPRVDVAELRQRFYGLAVRQRARIAKAERAEARPASGRALRRIRRS